MFHVCVLAHLLSGKNKKKDIDNLLKQSFVLFWYIMSVLCLFTFD